MKNFYFKLSTNIAAVFMTVILLSFIPDLYPKFFGDVFCEGRFVDVPSHINDHNDYVSTSYKGCDVGPDTMHIHNPTWHWGYRHWLWLLMGVCLFVVQIVRIIKICDQKDE